MKRFAFLAASAALLAAGPATAAPFLYNFTAANGSTGVISFVTDANNVAQSASGAINGVVITGLSNYAGADEVAFQTVPTFDFAGLSVATANGDAYNFFYDGSGDVLLDRAVSPTGNPFTEPSSRIVSETVLSGSAVPEPATWAMMLLGFGMVGFGLRYRRKSTAVSFA